MGMFSTIYTSVSGLMATENGLSVIGNNIANLNTAGFKGSRVLFNDLLGSQLDQIGKGVELQTVKPRFIQGTFMTSDNPLDFAIDGNGFFIVSDPNNNNAEYYTRDGAFLLNNEAYIVNADGLRLQGYMADTAGVIGTTVSDIQIPMDANGNFTLDASATTTASIQVNLNAADSVPSVAWSLSATTGPAAGSYNHSAAMNIYDNEGNLHTVDTYFRKTGTSTWEAHVVRNEGKTTNDYQEQLITPITFDTNGVMTAPAAATNINLTWNSDDWDGDSGTAATTPAAQTISLDLSDSTQYASAHSTSLVQTNGYTTGSLLSFSTDKEGIISGWYSNGQARNIAQLTLANFSAPTELERKGKNLFAESSGAGTRTESTPGSGGVGTVNGSSLEMSNVDLAEEFVTMIMMQRAFQANGRVMSTTDEMLTKLVNI